MFNLRSMFNKEVKFKSQTEWVKYELAQNGRITRNMALRNYVSRLGAIIYGLKEEGYVIRGRFIPCKTPWGEGRDYEYKVVERP